MSLAAINNLRMDLYRCRSIEAHGAASALLTHIFY